MTRTAVTLLFLLSGCGLVPTINSSEPVAGWPTLIISEHRVSSLEMRNVCAKYASDPLATVMACSLFNLPRRECHIYVDADFFSPAILAHEVGHCNGYPHLFDGTRAQMERMVAMFNRLRRAAQQEGSQ